MFIVLVTCTNYIVVRCQVPLTLNVDTFEKPKQFGGYARVQTEKSSGIDR